uniref:Protein DETOXIFICATION n=1 Tax=Cajanus cajan TaxID=3821 RepID=A0A151SNT8_CAJCA|nr:Multidrug and toxin extrusion protein 1 [Cajanus cajan]
MSASSKQGEKQSTNDKANRPPSNTQKCPFNVKMVLEELRLQRGIALPLVAMNIACFAKTAITTAFLGHLGELNLAGGALGFTFANVTGFSVLNGLSAAMEPICGQAHGANNVRLLHKTLLMTTLLLLLASLPISFLWLNVDKILVPYLSSQCITLPTMFSSAVALAFHIPVNMVLSKSMGLRGVSISVWVTDLMVVILLATYVVVLERRNGRRIGGWWDQNMMDWIRLIKLCGSCCLNTCLEWWCYEILVLLTGHLSNAMQEVGVIAIVLNFDYLLYSVMLSLATCVSTRVSNELGANRAGYAYKSARVSLVVSVISGCVGGSMMVAARGIWGNLFSRDKGVIKGVKKTMLLMALVEVFNFPVAICGGIVRGTARPWLGMYANLGGFYLLAVPLGVIFAFKLRLGLAGLIIGFLIGVVTCLILLLMFIVRISWEEEATKAQTLVCATQVEESPANEVSESIEDHENDQVCKETLSSQILVSEEKLDTLEPVNKIKSQIR